MNESPQITVGMPAYNSEDHIGVSIEALLAQSYGDFELIISDNASTDGTREIVEKYRKLDSRIRYERQSANIGANPNYSYLVGRARGEFFKWTSSSDWCAPTFLERCGEVLRAHADTVLVVPRTRLFGTDPSVSQDYADDIEILDDAPATRLANLMSRLGLNNAMNGLIRTAALQRTHLIEPYLAADVVLMGHLALLGKFRLLPESLLYRRMDIASATALKDKNAVWKHHYPKLTSRMLFQVTKRHVGWFRAVWAAPLTLDERLRALSHVAKGCYWERGRFLQDLRVAWWYCTRRSWPD